MTAWRRVFGVGLLVWGCEARPAPDTEASPALTAGAQSESTSATATATATPTAGPSATPSAEPGAPPCPVGMLPIPGGEYWAGKATPGGNDEEHPRHKTRVHAFCLDRTERTAAAYQACVERGACTPAGTASGNCTAGGARPEHPINCVSWEQADTYCRAHGARLPTELEWEYAARGGAEYRRYSWGDEPPDGRTCWKHAGTCPVGTHSEGAFGLHDMNGNVWEWTATWFGPYPWPSETGKTRVYRGGSFSRRFEKWLSLTLRNRLDPNESGSHLGFRCAALGADTVCPYGRVGDSCRHGVEDAVCPPPQVWNGVRCAAPGEVGCGLGQTLRPGFGCQGGDPERGPSRAATAPTEPVRAERDPRFDADCARFAGKRVHAYRFLGGTHAARNAAGQARGCKNRDVGVGWNSACCP